MMIRCPHSSLTIHTDNPGIQVPLEQDAELHRAHCTSVHCIWWARHSHPLTAVALNGELCKLSHTVQQTRRNHEITSLSHFDVYVKFGTEGVSQPVNQGMQAMAREGTPGICAEFVIVHRSDDG